MMKYTILAAVAALLVTACLPKAEAAGEVGAPAPAFSGVDTNGNTVSLSDFAGKTVILEWNNPECPYVVKHYDSGNMQKLQADAIADGAVWLTVNSGAEGLQGHMTAEQANAYIAEKKAKQTAYLLDTDGTIGKAYGAKVTPHMYVIDKDGTLVYAGAIDDDSSAKIESVQTANNYVTAALASLKAGEPIERMTSKAYGCGVKYAE